MNNQTRTNAASVNGYTGNHSDSITNAASVNGYTANHSDSTGDSQSRPSKGGTSHGRAISATATKTSGVMFRLSPNQISPGPQATTSSNA